MGKLEDAEEEIRALKAGELEVFDPPEIIEERIQKALNEN